MRRGKIAAELGTEYVGAYGYVLVKTDRRANRGWARKHVVVVEAVTGRKLPDGAIVHHVDGDKLNNDPNNLVVCQDRAYHNLIEKRTRAFRATGHADWRYCQYCRVWDAPANLYITPILGGQARHRECHALAMRRRSA